ncbi:MAG: hypothetical protein ACP5JG_11495 [Anaerolineae bacterium]
MREVWALIITVALLLPGCATFSAAPSATPTAVPSPVRTRVPTSTPSPTLTPSPSPTATPTPVPTPDPAQLQAAAEAGLTQVLTQVGDADLVCLRYEDLDADSLPEWLALVHQTTASPPRLAAFVLDDPEAYALEPAQPEPGVADVGFGQYPTCELVIRDVNLDGVVEIGIFGHAQDNETLLHLFAWDGAAYRRLGFFSGDAGVAFVDADGDLEEEIWEGYRVLGAPSLAWYVIHTWEDGTYGWTSDRYDWYFSDRPQSYPTHKPEYAVISFYLALDDRDLPTAYDLLLPQNRPDYAAWANGYATTVRVSVGDAHPIPAAMSEDRGRIAAMVTAWDNDRGVIVGRLWSVEWDVVRTDGGWRLQNSTSDLLDEWTVTYWP